MIDVFALVNGGERLPQRATSFSAGFDVFANEDVEIMAGETVTVGLGIALDKSKHWLVMGDADAISLHDLQQGYYLELHPRSSLRAKGIGGGVGIIDIDYPDEIKIVLSNSFVPALLNGEIIGYQECALSIKRGDKIGQLILKRHEGYLLPAEYTVNAERTGGFGSTDG